MLILFHCAVLMVWDGSHVMRVSFFSSLFCSLLQLRHAVRGGFPVGSHAGVCEQLRGDACGCVQVGAQLLPT